MNRYQKSFTKFYLNITANLSSVCMHVCTLQQQTTAVKIYLTVSWVNIQNIKKKLFRFTELRDGSLTCDTLNYVQQKRELTCVGNTINATHIIMTMYS